jgi:alpha-beta hydrolase superfamily lysophospholipase
MFATPSSDCARQKRADDGTELWGDVSYRMFGKSIAVVGFSLMVATAACGGAPDDSSAASSDDLVALSTDCRDLSSVPGMTIERPTVDGGNLNLRIGVMDPSGEPRGDVLFLHGFADRFDNHLPLFETWRSAGLRVIAFDYPSHGETCGRGIDRYKINGVAELAAEVVKRKSDGTKRPLLLAGWSTGGLIAVRMLEAPQIAPLDRPVKGAFLLAPGVDVRVVVGDKAMVTTETLTHDPNPPHRGEITPKSPLNTPIFASDLLLNAHLSGEDRFPTNVPTFVVTAGEDEDRYVDTNGVKDWIRARQGEGARVVGFGCDGARHELDNEISPIRDDVRNAAARFATWAVGDAAGSAPVGSGAACRSY